MSILSKTAVPPGPAPPCGDASQPAACVDGAPSVAAVPVERNRFFTGKYMTARDFRDEQTYFLGHHRLHQRVLHGWGIVVGLDICLHPDPSCAARGWFVVTPGIAVDPSGRELVLKEATPVKIDALFSQDVDCGCESEHGTKSDKVNGYWPNYAPPEGTDFLLGLRYGEQLVEQVPVLYDDNGCGQRSAPNRVLERPCLRFRPYDPGDHCWGPANPPLPTYPPLPSTDPCKCLATVHDFSLPEAPCGPYGFVPLARFKYQRQQDGVIKVLVYDQTGRRYLFGPLHPYTLTHIDTVNWKHGDRTNVEDLVNAYEKGRDADEKAGKADAYRHHAEKPHPYMRLTITFDGPLCDDSAVVPPREPDDGVGFYRRILKVRYETENGGFSPLPHPGIAYLTDCRTKLHYDIPRKCLEEFKKHITSPMIHIYLNCDFLPDRKGRAVDGNHLRGALAHGGKTGDGVEGGLFESWFRLEW